jgi:hypothetical protein
VGAQTPGPGDLTTYISWREKDERLLAEGVTKVFFLDKISNFSGT